jgi:flagellar assembly factor FliW
MEIEIQSTRFGMLLVDEERVINFQSGLLGFPEHKRFALIQTGEENYFFWLQSVDEPNLAFVVTDPALFFKGYEVPLRDETREELRLQDPREGEGEGDSDGGREGADRIDNPEHFLQVFVICNKVDEWLTGNLLGPLVVNAQNRLGQQVVLTEKKWTTRQPLMRLEADVPLAKSA